VSVSFADVVGTIPCSTAAREAAASVPIPWWDESGFRTAAEWWATEVCGVFPLVPANAGGEHAGKVPLLPGTATDPARQLRALGDIATVWNAQPLCNVGIVTIAQNILVIDIDPRDGGTHSIIDWCAEIGVDLADVPRQTSPRDDGGVHLFWRLPEGAPVIRCGSPLDGVDIPWQVPVAPSLRHVQTGTDHKGEPVLEFRPYRWTAGDPRRLPTAPAELIDGLGQLGRIKGVKPPRSAKPGQRYGPVPSDVAELAETGIPRGRQNTTVQALATSMARRNVEFTEAVDTIWSILAVSPQDHRDRWTRTQLDGERGIVTRAYEFIAEDRRQEEEQHSAWAASLRASFSRPRG
jgi:hypothetical protein